LGGFILPIMFGALVDLTGVRSSAFMLLYGITWVSLTWMYFTEVRTTTIVGRERHQSVRVHAEVLAAGD
jgi:NNP family nitrate/nitrite transporter-like MFS transporter